LPVTVSLPFPIYCSNNVTETIPPFFLTIAFSITHPPRA
jgi:hypothetical protein